MIVDLSYPSGRSINDGLSPMISLVTYALVDAALRFIKQLGWNTMSIKVDLKSVYRMVPIHPQDRQLFGVWWDDQILLTRHCPFGLYSARKLFTTVPDAIG